MSLDAGSLLHSSSGDELEELLNAELDAISYASGEEDSYDDDADCDLRVKRHKVDLPEEIATPHPSSSQLQLKQTLVSCHGKNICQHPGALRGMCVICGQKMDDDYGIPFRYIHKDLRVSVDETIRLREEGLKKLVRCRKLYLVLDLDHTLLNSVCLPEITVEEEYLNVERNALPDYLRESLHRLEWMNMMTKLRPFVHSFLKEANNLFEMYIYTMGKCSYAREMAKLIDPDNVYFNGKVISKGDSTKTDRKSLDVLLGQASAVLILDDTEAVWESNKHNLILMERYHFFAASFKHSNSNRKSLSELKIDESESKGALATILKVLQRIHTSFFHILEAHQNKDELVYQDVREVLRTVRASVLQGCKLVFSGFSEDERNRLWKMAEGLGAKCYIDIDPSVTHVVSTNARTHKSRWAMEEGNNKYLVNKRWIEESNYFWEKQPEENFVVIAAGEG